MIELATMSATVVVGRGILDLAWKVKEISGSDVISGHFAWEGNRISGSEKITVSRCTKEDDETIWWFSVDEVQEYTFIRMPVIQSGLYELLGQKVGEDNPDEQFWRWEFVDAALLQPES
ncbi:MAG TPA: hypothetical protein EYN74_05680, partial [Nitrospirales bacterium]|nr:hypothetical protein [Nitrospirales bacterium]